MADYKEFSEKRKIRRVKRRVRRTAVLLAGVLVMLGVAWLGGKAIGQPAVAGSSSSQQQAASGQGGTQPTTVLPLVSKEDWNVATPVEASVEAAPIVTPDFRMMALPENGRVDMSYFDTATFIGDSITQGLEIYTTGIPNAHYCAYKSIGPKAIYDGSVWPRANGDKEVPMDAIVASQPDNVYILLGTNAMVNTQDDQLIEYYREMVRRIRENLLPGVGVYIQSITPVRPGTKFEMSRINDLNNRLAQLAHEENVYFVDLSEPLAGEDGYLREDFAGSDGIHMNPAGYTAWTEYLVTHTAYHPRNPYIEGGAPYSLPVASEE